MVEKLHHSSGFFLGQGGLRIYYQGWVPEKPVLAIVLVQFQRAMQQASQKAADLAVPSLFLQGDADLLVDPEQTVAVYNRVKNPDKSLRIYPGYYHELFNDPGKDKVFQDMLDWLTAHGWL